MAICNAFRTLFFGLLLACHSAFRQDLSAVHLSLNSSKSHQHAGPKAGICVKHARDNSCETADPSNCGEHYVTSSSTKVDHVIMCVLNQVRSTCQDSDIFFSTALCVPHIPSFIEERCCGKQVPCKDVQTGRWRRTTFLTTSRSERRTYSQLAIILLKQIRDFDFIIDHVLLEGQGDISTVERAAEEAKRNRQLLNDMEKVASNIMTPANFASRYRLPEGITEADIRGELEALEATTAVGRELNLDLSGLSDANLVHRIEQWESACMDASDRNQEVHGVCLQHAEGNRCANADGANCNAYYVIDNIQKPALSCINCRNIQMPAQQAFMCTTSLLHDVAAAVRGGHAPPPICQAERILMNSPCVPHMPQFIESRCCGKNVPCIKSQIGRWRQTRFRARDGREYYGSQLAMGILDMLAANNYDLSFLADGPKFGVSLVTRALEDQSFYRKFLKDKELVRLQSMSQQAFDEQYGRGALVKMSDVQLAETLGGLEVAVEIARDLYKDLAMFIPQYTNLVHRVEQWMYACTDGLNRLTEQKLFNVFSFA